VTCASYLGYGAMIGGCYLSEASGNEEEYWYQRHYTLFPSSQIS
jgi:hypothetical protein